MSAPHRPVRVNYFIDGLSRAGTETQLLALIHSLDRKVVEPSLTLLNGNSDESRALEPTDCPVLRLGVTSLKRPNELARASATLLRFWRRQAVDVVQTYFLDSTYFGVPLARLAGVKRVIRVRNNVGHWLTPKHRGLGRLIGRLADVTLTNSEPGRQSLRLAERGNRNKLVVLENGVDLDRFTDVPPPVRRDGIVTVGAVGNLRPVKGMDVLVRAAARLPGVRFLVAGEGDQRGELQSMIDSLGMTQRFTLLGQVTDMPALFADIDVAVLPSRAEGMSNALLEFMAAGRPVVATRVGANAQVLEAGKHGLLVPPGDDDSLANAISQLVRDERLAMRLAASARGHVEEHYGRKAMRLRFEQFYQRLCA
jgi:glycosyltransferase involved in cell wall biosynthesis